MMKKIAVPPTGTIPAKKTATPKRRPQTARAWVTVVRFPLLMALFVLASFFYVSPAYHVVSAWVSHSTSSIGEQVRVLLPVPLQWEPPAAEPARLRIPKLSIDAPVHKVGLTSNGAMEVPKSAWDIGWYRYGAKPGDEGNAVLAGHLDSQTRAKGVFWDLKLLEPGDMVDVEDADDRLHTFRVVAKEKYGTTGAPMEKIFGTATGSKLNLITCGGPWSKSLGMYTERLVVFTEKLPPVDELTIEN